MGSRVEVGSSARIRARLAAAAAAASAVALLGAAAARAATAPAAITGPVTTVAATTATVSGTVNPNGDATSWHFDYGTSTGYGTSTPSSSAGSTTANTGVTANLTGLTPGTTYHYRVVATNTGGTTQGADGIFTTAATPVPQTGTATAITSTGATLNGTVNANGRPATYWFEYGKTTSYGGKTTVTSAGSGTAPASATATISGLAANTTYHFRLDATSDAGTALGNDVSFTTAGGIPVSAPSVTTRPATSVTSSGAKLNGAVNPGGQTTTWYFDYGTTAGYGQKTPVTTINGGTKAVSVSADVSGLGAGIYHFRLVASNATGTAYGSDLTFGSAAAPVVQTGTAQGASTTGVTLTGSVNPGGGTTNWYFEYGPTTSYGTKTPAKAAGNGTSVVGVSAAIDKLAAGSTYHYRVVASNSGGTSYGSDVTFTTVAALTLTASTGESVFGHGVTLSGVVWSRQTGVQVAVLAQPYGSSSFSTVATVTTGPGGTWTYLSQPNILTTYKASAPDGSSTTATVGLRPAVSLHVITGNRFATRVVAGKSFEGRTVQLQRLLPGNRWVTLSRVKLNARSGGVFSALVLPRGTSLVRVAMSVNQAGAGYLGAFSRTLSYKR